jgi:hypothetical protein
MAQDGATGAVLEFATIAPGREDAFAAWYRAERMPGWERQAGVRSVRPLRSVDTPARRLTLVELAAAALPASGAPVARAAAGGGAAVAAPAQIETWIYAQTWPPPAETPARPAEARYLFLVATDVRPELQPEFNAWYDADHIPNLLKTRHIHRARRFRGQGGAPGFLTLYDVSHTVPVDDAAREITGTAWSKRVIPRFTLRLREIFEDD